LPDNNGRDKPPNPPEGDYFLYLFKIYLHKKIKAPFGGLGVWVWLVTSKSFLPILLVTILSPSSG